MGKPNVVVVNFKDLELLRWLRAEAEASERSMSAMIRLLIRHGRRRFERGDVLPDEVPDRGVGGMSWAKIDDRLFVHPKFLGVSLSAAGLWVFGLSYAASLERDGWFPAEALSRLTSRVTVTDCETFAHELVHAGLWIREADGYRIHDFLKYNFSRKRLDKKRKQDAKRQRQSRIRHAVTRRGVRAESTTPVPSRPVPSPDTLSLRSRASRRWRFRPESEALSPERLAYALQRGMTESEAHEQWAEMGLHEYGQPKTDTTKAWQLWCRRWHPAPPRKGVTPRADQTRTLPVVVLPGLADRLFASIPAAPEWELAPLNRPLLQGGHKP